MSARPKLLLIHWNAGEAAAESERIARMGYRVEPLVPSGTAFLKSVDVDADAPRAIVISLGRMPSQGRDIAILLRRREATRHIPLIFMGGLPEKVERVKQVLPDATYTEGARLRAAIRQAIAAPARNALKPPAMAGYSGTPLPKKLRIAAGSRVALINAPADFLETLGDLPEGVRFEDRPKAGCDPILWFVRSREELELQIDLMESLCHGSMWICWPKRTSRLACDVSENLLREVALPRGLVDYKVCAVDADWSGLLLTHRAAVKPRSRRSGAGASETQ